MSRQKPLRGLTTKQLRFIDEYFKDFNATQAAIRAGYSLKAAQQHSSRLLSNVVVSEEIVKRRQVLAKKAGISRERWLEELMCVAVFNPAKMFDDHGNLLEICEMPQHVRRAVASFEIVENFEGNGESRKAVGHTKKFKFLDKLKALKQIGEALGYFDTVPVPGEHNRQIDIVFVSPEGKKSMAAQPPRAFTPLPEVKFVSSRGES